ncbi:MAG: 50S ribosomal protein L10 [Phycisphaerales bacterium]
MSKPVKQMVMRDYEQRFVDIDGALVVDLRGIGANDNNDLRRGLQSEGVRVTIVKNTLAKKSIAGTHLEGLTEALEGPSALCYGGESVVNVARALVGWAKKIEDLDLKGAVLDGEYFDGEAGVKRLSDFPTREEAQATAVQLVLTPGGNVVGAALAGGSKILGVVKEIEERLERGEAISKV